MRTRIFACTPRYVQGAGVIQKCGDHISQFGSKVLVVSGPTVWETVGKDVETSLKEAKVESVFRRFNGESSDIEIERLGQIGKDEGAHVVVGLGGGKCADTVKAVSDDLGLPLIFMPTIASSDAPCSALSVIYSEEGAFERYRPYDHHPDMILIDTRVCAEAPPLYFASGMCDAMATFIEARAARRLNTITPVGGGETIASMAIAHACEDTLMAYGISAYEAVKNNLVTPAVDAVVEANTLLSGVGFETAGLAGAHAIHNGFTALHGDIHHMTHGQKVAYGTLTHMMLNQEADEVMARYIRFYRAIDMPTSLEEMHLDKVSYEDLVSVGEVANREGDTLRNLATDLTPVMVADALIAVDVFAKTVT